MKVPHTLVFLGFVYELVWRASGQSPRITLFKLKKSLNTPKGKNAAGLFSNGSGTSIYVLPYINPDIEIIEGVPGRDAALSKNWAGYEADILIRLNIPKTAGRLKKIGSLEKIEYTSDKLERARDQKGRFSLYTHKYKKPLELFADREKNPRLFGAKLNAKTLVTSRGLIG